MMQRSNVLGRRPRPTKKSYRDAVKKIVLRLQADHGLNDPELADRLGCSAPTIANARKEQTNLDGVTLANIEYEFGPSALDPFLELGGSRSVPLFDQVPVTLNPTLEIAEVLHRLIETQRPDSPGGTETLAVELRAILPQLRDGRLALDALIAKAEAADTPPLRAVAG